MAALASLRATVDELVREGRLDPDDAAGGVLSFATLLFELERPRH